MLPGKTFSLHMPKSVILMCPSASSITLSSFRSLRVGWGAAGRNCRKRVNNLEPLSSNPFPPLKGPGLLTDKLCPGYGGRRGRWQFLRRRTWRRGRGVRRPEAGHRYLPLFPHPPLVSKTHAAWGSLNLPSCWMWYIKSPPVTYSITKYRRSWGGGGQGLRGKDTSIRGGKRPFLPTPGQRGRLWAHAIRKAGQLCTPTPITESPPTPSSVTLNCRVFPSSLPGI